MKWKTQLRSQEWKEEKKMNNTKESGQLVTTLGGKNVLMLSAEHLTDIDNSVQKIITKTHVFNIDELNALGDQIHALFNIEDGPHTLNIIECEYTYMRTMSNIMYNYDVLIKTLVKRFESYNYHRRRNDLPIINIPVKTLRSFMSFGEYLMNIANIDITSIEALISEITDEEIMKSSEYKYTNEHVSVLKKKSEIMKQLVDDLSSYCDYHEKCNK